MEFGDRSCVVLIFHAVSAGLSCFTLPSYLILSIFHPLFLCCSLHFSNHQYCLLSCVGVGVVSRTALKEEAGSANGSNGASSASLPVDEMDNQLAGFLAVSFEYICMFIPMYIHNSCPKCFAL